LSHGSGMRLLAADPRAAIRLLAIMEHLHPRHSSVPPPWDLEAKEEEAWLAMQLGEAEGRASSLANQNAVLWHELRMKEEETWWLRHQLAMMQQSGPPLPIGPPPLAPPKHGMIKMPIEGIMHREDNDNSPQEPGASSVTTPIHAPDVDARHPEFKHRSASSMDAPAAAGGALVPVSGQAYRRWQRLTGESLPDPRTLRGRARAKRIARHMTGR